MNHRICGRSDGCVRPATALVRRSSKFLGGNDARDGEPHGEHAGDPPATPRGALACAGENSQDGLLERQGPLPTTRSTEVFDPPGCRPSASYLCVMRPAGGSVKRDFGMASRWGQGGEG